MGMFDTVVFKCPSCHAEIEVQSKAGECRLERFEARAVPLAIVASIDGDTTTCEGCGEPFAIESCIEIKTLPMRLR